MATYSRTMRRGLPRQSGGEAWPPAGAAPADLHDVGAPDTPAEPSDAAVPTATGAAADATTTDSRV